MHAPQTWHHGLMAEYWARRNIDAPEVEAYRPYLQEPILDAGCGAGRLLGPWHEEGSTSTGATRRPTWSRRARERAPGATIWVSPPARARPAAAATGTIVVCGVVRPRLDARPGRRGDRAGCTMRSSRGGTLVLDNEEKPFRRRVRDWSEPSEGEYRSRPASTLSTRPTATVRLDDPRREGRPHRGAQADHAALVPRASSCSLLERSGFTVHEVKPGVDENLVVYVASRDGDLQPLPR